MKQSRERKGPGPRVAGFAAGTVALGTGLVSIAYFVELRGAGFRAELASGRGPELMVVGGAVLLLALVAQLMVASIARRSTSGTDLRRLLQRVEEVDITDPEALRQFDSVPVLRDIVAQLVTEKTHVHELSDRFEGLRGEIDALLGGMRRATQDLGHMRQENLSPIGIQIASLWNALVTKAREAEARAEEAETAGSQAKDTEGSEITGLVTRLDELESELGRLRTATAAPAPEPQGVGDWPAPEPLRAGDWPAPEPLRAGDWPAPEPLRSERWPEPESQRNEGRPEPKVETQRTWQPMSLAEPSPAFAAGSGGVESETPEEMTPEPPHWPAPATPSRPVPSAPTWSAGAAPPRPEPSVSKWPAGVVPPRPEPSAPTRAAGAAPSRPAPAEREIEGMRLPHFVERPRYSSTDRVEVTYELGGTEDAVDLPSSALLFDAEEEPEADEKVFDLRTFGATEFDK